MELIDMFVISLFLIAWMALATNLQGKHPLVWHSRLLCSLPQNLTGLALAPY